MEIWFDDTKDDECPICFQNKAYVQFVKLECEHEICISCYSSWHLDRRKTECCICRKVSSNLSEDSKEESKENMGEGTLENRNNQNKKCMMYCVLIPVCGCIIILCIFDIKISLFLLFLIIFVISFKKCKINN
tara:strand:+ start:6476 stop:6874 length:399 start_codon:yes stop_codon:yes gene_type:complete